MVNLLLNLDYIKLYYIQIGSLKKEVNPRDSKIYEKLIYIPNDDTQITPSED